MKYKLGITLIILALFVLAQLVGLFVVNFYSPIKVVNGEQVNVSAPNLPFGLETPEIEQESDYAWFFSSLIVAFMLAVVLLFLFTKFKFSVILKIWFFVVIFISLSISFIAIFSKLLPGQLAAINWIAFGIALLLAILKISGKSFIAHNFTELLIYPGIGAVFVPILNIWTVGALLILISIYDIWAVWHSGIMQKMAKYQINHLRIFTGLFVPYLSKSVRRRIKKMKKTMSKSKLSKKKIGVNVAILGGGDIVFPIIAAGVMLKTLGLGAALLVTLGATLGLAYLFFAAKKMKFYPAMPFISAGIFLGILASYLVF